MKPRPKKPNREVIPNPMPNNPSVMHKPNPPNLNPKAKHKPNPPPRSHAERKEKKEEGGIGLFDYWTLSL